MPTTQLPAQTRATCPCPVIELAFTRLEALCPYPDELVEPARKLYECAVSARLAERRAALITRAAMTVCCGADVAETGFKRLAAIRGSAAYAHALQQSGRHTDATLVALDVLAESVGMRIGTDDGKRELWNVIIGQVMAAKGMT